MSGSGRRAAAYWTASSRGAGRRPGWGQARGGLRTRAGGRRRVEIWERWELVGGGRGERGLCPTVRSGTANIPPEPGIVSWSHHHQLGPAICLATEFQRGSQAQVLCLVYRTSTLVASSSARSIPRTCHGNKSHGRRATVLRPAMAPPPPRLWCCPCHLRCRPPNRARCRAPPPSPCPRRRHRPPGVQPRPADAPPSPPLWSAAMEPPHLINSGL